MKTFVLNKNNKPLMPCSPRKARVLLREDKAKVVKRTPFTIKLINGSSSYIQPVIAGMDTGSQIIGTAAVTNNEVVYQAETLLRGEQIKKRMGDRASLRRTRRGQKTRYRKPRFKNRAASTREGRLPPSTKHKVDSHFREKKYIESLLPVSNWRVETSNFDTHAISNPNVSKARWWTYQRGDLYGFQNVKQYVLNRDNYTCQMCPKSRKKKESTPLHVHHIVFRSNGGSDQKDNLITLCHPCHDKLHKKKKAQEFSLKLKKKVPNTKHATETSIIASQIKKRFGDFEETFGFITKVDRMEQKLEKKHFIDACVIASGDKKVSPKGKYLVRKMLAKGSYAQTKATVPSKKIIANNPKGVYSTGSSPKVILQTGKSHGFRAWDQVIWNDQRVFLRSARRNGYSEAIDILSNRLFDGKMIKLKQSPPRISARKTVAQDFVKFG